MERGAAGPTLLALTAGDPSGIGPEITVAAWRSRQRQAVPPFYLLGDPDFLRARVPDVPLALVQPCEATAAFTQALPLVPLRARFTGVPGRPDTANAAGIVESIERAVADVMDSVLAIFEDNKQIQITREDNETFYKLDDETRLELSFYRNTLVHYFVPEALLASAILRFDASTIDYDLLLQDTLFLSKLFKYEWIYAERAEFENVFERTLRYFEASGWLTIDDKQVVIKTTSELEFFRRIVLTFVEAYTIVAEFLHQLATREFEDQELIKDALKQGKSDYLRGETIFFESISKPTFVNAVRLLVDWGVLDKKATPGRKRDTITYKVADEWLVDERHLELLKKLKSFVYAAPRSEKSRELH